MSSSTDPLTELVNQLTRLPGIGERTATRLALTVIERQDTLAQDLARALVDAKERIIRCSGCGNFTADDPCSFCASSSRDRAIVAVVAATSDIGAIERTGEFDGLYHVLHGLIRPLDGVGPDALNLDTLVRRVGEGEIREVIVATSPSVEGEATAMYIRNLLTPLGVEVTRIARGVPMGGELEYADRATLGRAFAGRTKL